MNENITPEQVEDYLERREQRALIELDYAIKPKQRKKRLKEKDLPPAIVLNKAELERLLNSGPPTLKTVMVRCNHYTGMWEVFEENGPATTMLQLVLINARFEAHTDSTGCGGGVAIGQMLPSSGPLTLPSEGVMRIGFDPWLKTFYTSGPGRARAISGVDYLIMGKDCKARIIGPTFTP